MTTTTQMVTPDLCDAYPDVEVLEPLFANFGGVDSFYGPIRTVKCFEDNSMVKQAVAEPGEGAVLVVDAGGSHRCAMTAPNLTRMRLLQLSSDHQLSFLHRQLHSS